MVKKFLQYVGFALVVALVVVGIVFTVNYGKLAQTNKEQTATADRVKKLELEVKKGEYKTKCLSLGLTLSIISFVTGATFTASLFFDNKKTISYGTNKAR